MLIYIYVLSRRADAGRWTDEILVSNPTWGMDICLSSLRVIQILYCVSLKIYKKIANYFCELKFTVNTHQRP